MIKIRVIGNSIVAGFGLGNPATDDILAKIEERTPGVFTKSKEGVSGAQIGQVQSFLANFAVGDGELYIIWIEGGINDLYEDQIAANTLTANTLYNRVVSICNAAKAKGSNVIVVFSEITVDFRSNPAHETIRQTVNQMLRDNKPASCDYLINIGSDEFMGNQTNVTEKKYLSDGVHHTARGNEWWALLGLDSFGLDPRLNTPVVSIFDLRKNRWFNTEAIAPYHTLFGGDEDNSYEWWATGWDDVERLLHTGAKPEAEDLEFQTGDKNLRLKAVNGGDESNTDLDILVQTEKSNGIGLIVPPTETAALSDVLAFTVQGVTDPKIFKTRGNSVIQNIDGNNFEIATDDMPDEIEVFAEEEMWSGAPSNDDNSLNGSLITQTRLTNAKLTKPGQFVEFVWDGTLHADNAIGMHEKTNGNTPSINGNKIFTAFEGVSPIAPTVTALDGSDEDHPERNIQLNDTVRVMLGDDRKYVVQRKGESDEEFTTIYETLANSFNNGAGFEKSGYTHCNHTPTVFPRLVIGGESAAGDKPTGWNSARLILNTYIAPTAGFSMPASINAIETLEITDESENGASVEWRISNSHYENELLLETGFTPDLTKYLRDDENQINQKVINPAGNAEATHSVNVTPYQTSVDAPPANIPDTPSGVTLHISVKGVDTGNHQSAALEGNITMS